MVSSSLTIIAEAPSLICEAFPAVTESPKVKACFSVFSFSKIASGLGPSS